MGSLVNPASLALTVDAVNAALFEQRRLSKAEREAAARFIAARQGQLHSYRGLFAPLPEEPRKGLTLFTGERVVNSEAGTLHILGEEAYRALLKLEAGGAAVQSALQRAAEKMSFMLGLPENSSRGRYCCGRCSVAVWRCLQAGGYGGNAEFISRGLKSLSFARDGAGRWRSYPYWYTLLALTEIPAAAARAELHYAAPRLEAYARRAPRAETFSQRRQALAQRALTRL